MRFLARLPNRRRWFRHRPRWASVGWWSCRRRVGHPIVSPAEGSVLGGHAAAVVATRAYLSEVKSTHDSDWREMLAGRAIAMLALVVGPPAEGDERGYHDDAGQRAR